MSMLSRVSLAGIRSFGQEKQDTQRLNFQSPLTLILGQNGCGKTTIIEALKCITTGEFPPGTNKGEGFIHDPKLYNCNESNGQIKLEILDSKNDLYTISRTMKTTQLKNANSLSFKTVDTTITKNNEKTITNRCVDVNNFVCDLLGVSKPILNSVIFCHQDESTWPLEEGKKLKEKFDAIFDSVKYNKTCEQIRGLIKEYEVDLKCHNLRLDNYNDKRKMVKKKQKSLKENEEKKIKIDEEINQITDENKPIVARLREIIKLEEDIVDLEKALVAKKCASKSIKEHIEIILKNLNGEEYSGTDAELRAEIKRTDDEHAMAEENINELDDRLKELNGKQETGSEKISAKQVEIGGLQADKQQNDDNVQSRRIQIQKAAKALELVYEFDNLNTLDDVQSAIYQLKMELKKLKNKMLEDKAQFEQEDAVFQKRLDKCRDKCVTTKSEIKSKNKLIEEYQQAISTVQSQLRDLSTATNEVDQIKRKITLNDESMESLKSSNDNTLPKKIEQNNKKIQEIEVELSVVEEEHKVLQNNLITDNELQSQKQRNTDCTNKLLNLNEKHEDNFKMFFEIVPQNNLKTAIENILTREKRNLSKLEQNKLKLDKEITTTETKLNMKIENVKEMEKELEHCNTQLENITEKRSLNEALSDITEQLEKAETDQGSLKYLKHIFDKYITEFRKPTPSCPICETNFSQNKQKVEGIVQKMKKQINEIPSRMEATSNNLTALKNKQKELILLEPVQVKIRKLQIDIPSTKKIVQALNSTLEDTRNELQNITDNIKKEEKKINIAALILNDAGLIEKYQTDINITKQKINELEAQLVPTQSNKSIEQVSMLMDNLKEDMKSLNLEINSLKQKADRYNNAIQKLRDEKNNLVEKQLNLMKNLQSVAQKESQLKENQEKEESLRLEVNELETQLKIYCKELGEIQSQKNDAKMKNITTSQKIENKYNSQEKEVNYMIELHKKIEQYDLSNKETKLNVALNELQRLKDELNKLDSMKQKVIDLKADYQMKIANNEKILRKLQDNVMLRNKKKELQVVEESIIELQQNIGDQNKSSLIGERLKLTNKNNELVNRSNRLKGSSGELTNVIKDIKLELQDKQFKDVDLEYLNQKFTNRCEELVISELKTYLGGLEYAIMQYHKRRMIQINERLRYLWRCIYKGNDIDHIQIKTDETTAAGKRRTFNYKVMQCKRNTEMEMRGRCSAGQKVLACLLIRIVLAETFSKHCGILTLDEPTTNLDKENIVSLCSALADIINARQNEKNFQLVIITHDQEFLETLLSMFGNVRYYFKVSRNPNGLSIINKCYADELGGR